MTLKRSKRSDVPPFIVMEVMRAAAELERNNRAVYHLEVGQPGTSAPALVKEAAKSAIDENRIGYTVALGIPELRAAIANHYREDYGQTVDPENIIVTTGSSTGFLLSFLSAFDPGDRVALAAPGYPCYRHILNILGVEPVLIETTLEDRFQLNPALLEAEIKQNGPLDGVIVASPSNPSGTMLSEAEMDAFIAFCEKENIRVISDEIYQGISYGRGFSTVLSRTKNALVINSFSKYFSMTGWRLGWLVMPDDLKMQIEKLAQNLFISAPTLSQVAAVAAFDAKEELENNIQLYARNRDILLNELPELGFAKLAPADGAFYIYADISEYTDDSKSFCQKILNETGVAVTPGVDFDPFNGHKTIRFSFAESETQIVGAVNALRGYIK